MRRLGRLFELLADGKYHHVEDLSLQLQVPVERLKKVLLLLSEHGIVSSSNDSVILDEDLRSLIEETWS